MKVEYDPIRDLLYLRFGEAATKAASTETVRPGVYADFDREGRLLGLEVLDASELMHHRIQFEVALTSSECTETPA